MKIVQSIGAGLLLIAACFVLLYSTQIHEFPKILICYSVAFIAYFWIYRLETGSLWIWIALGILIRFLSIYSFPGLSDDIYRFIWDGWLITEGVNPFSSTPAQFQGELGGFQQFLLNKMNSPDYYSVYPTVLQGIFAFTVWCIPAGIFMQSVLMKVILLLIELIGLLFAYKLIRLLDKDPRLLLLYFLNPLVIVELMGNLHMELVMIAGFSFFLWAWYSKQYVWAAFGLSFSVAAKLITIVVSPFLIRRVKLKKVFQFGLSLGVMLVVLFLPMFISTYENFGKGLDLYFQKFEFNASIYYLIRSVGYWYKGYNIIASLGPSLAIVSGLSILILAWKERNMRIESLCKQLCIALTIYYLLGTTVHPWYCSLLVFLALFSDLKYPIFWSYLAIFSYSKYYLDGAYYFYFIAIEYSILFLLILMEWKPWIRKSNPKPSAML